MPDACTRRCPPMSLLPAEGFVEEEDYVELDGMRICKPFVEKPASGGWAEVGDGGWGVGVGGEGVGVGVGVGWVR